MTPDTVLTPSPQRHSTTIEIFRRKVHILIVFITQGMYTYMEYLQKCFFKTTNWNEDNIFSNINATSQAILDFPIPNGLKVDSSSKTTDYLASSFTLSNFHLINGSLAYLYSLCPLTNTMGTKDVSLQDAIAGFRIIEPMITLRNQPVGSKTKKLRYNNNNNNINNKKYAMKKDSRNSLLYGRMYFPGSALEAMVIKRINENTQLLVKCVSNPHLERNGTMIVYLQNNTMKYLRELIYSTNESLIGLRFLYNLGNPITKNISPALAPKFDNSVVSVGTELWFAARTMSPGLSTALRYSTRSTSTGKPLTMTLAVNPILGHISSTYTVKTSVASTFCSKYDFNFFSYASNLSLGFELYSYARNKNYLSPVESSMMLEQPTATVPGSLHNQATKPRRESQRQKSEDYISSSDSDYTRMQVKEFGPGGRITSERKSNDRFPNKVSLIQNKRDKGREHFTNSSSNNSNSNINSNANTNLDAAFEEKVTTAFQNLVNASDFSSVVKVSTSLRDKTVKLLWEGRVKDFLVSTGARIAINPVTNAPEFSKFGINFSYAF